MCSIRGVMMSCIFFGVILHLLILVRVYGGCPYLCWCISSTSFTLFCDISCENNCVAQNGDWSSGASWFQLRDCSLANMQGFSVIAATANHRISLVSCLDRSVHDHHIHSQSVISTICSERFAKVSSLCEVVVMVLVVFGVAWRKQKRETERNEERAEQRRWEGRQ